MTTSEKWPLFPGALGDVVKIAVQNQKTFSGQLSQANPHILEAGNN